MTPMKDWPVTNARRFEIYARWSLYVFILLIPPLYLLLAREALRNPDAQPPIIGIAILAIAYTAATLAAGRWSFDRLMRGPAPTPWWFVGAWGLLLVALCAGTLALQIPRSTLLVSYALACFIGAATPRWSARRTLYVSLGVTVPGLLWIMLRDTHEVFELVLFWIVVWTAWTLGWMLRVLKEIQRANEMQKQLSVAEERLRISRDLHDVFGRTLATISVKSELASELARRGHHDRAADEMAQIRRIANTAGAEVRRVVRGEQRASWADEVEGARALLASAGIRCVIAGEEVPDEYAEVLAWVIREGVTNVLRHSRASQVSITTAVEPDEIALTVTNDGAGTPGSASASTGTGLRSMTERLSTVGGVLEHQRDGDWFWLTASIPVTQETPS